MKLTKEAVNQARRDFTAAHSLEKPNAKGRDGLRTDRVEDIVKMLDKFARDDYQEYIVPFPRPSRR